MKQWNKTHTPNRDTARTARRWFFEKIIKFVNSVIKVNQEKERVSTNGQFQWWKMGCPTDSIDSKRIMGILWTLC